MYSLHLVDHFHLEFTSEKKNLPIFRCFSECFIPAALGSQAQWTSNRTTQRSCTLAVALAACDLAGLPKGEGSLGFGWPGVFRKRWSCEIYQKKRQLCRAGKRDLGLLGVCWVFVGCLLLLLLLLLLFFFFFKGGLDLGCWVSWSISLTPLIFKMKLSWTLNFWPCFIHCNHPALHVKTYANFCGNFLWHFHQVVGGWITLRFLRPCCCRRRTRNFTSFVGIPSWDPSCRHFGVRSLEEFHGHCGSTRIC